MITKPLHGLFPTRHVPFELGVVDRGEKPAHGRALLETHGHKVLPAEQGIRRHLLALKALDVAHDALAERGIVMRQVRL